MAVAATKWDRSGTVMESIGHDQYWVKVDGTGRLALRNRRFLRAFQPATPMIDRQPAVPRSHRPTPTTPQGAATPSPVENTSAQPQPNTEESPAHPASLIVLNRVHIQTTSLSLKAPVQKHQMILNIYFLSIALVKSSPILCLKSLFMKLQ